MAIVQRRVFDIWRLVSAVGMRDTPGVKERRGTPELVGLAALFEAESQGLRYDPATAGRLLRSITLALSHPAIVTGDPMAPEEIVTLFLHGARVGGAPC